MSHPWYGYGPVAKFLKAMALGARLQVFELIRSRVFVVESELVGMIMRGGVVAEFYRAGASLIKQEMKWMACHFDATQN